MERYHVAAAQAKTKGDQRKARMHERIVKVCGGPVGRQTAPAGLAQVALILCPLQQYQEAIRAHKAGRTVDVAELPVPPGRHSPHPCPSRPLSLRRCYSS